MNERRRYTSLVKKQSNDLFPLTIFLFAMTLLLMHFLLASSAHAQYQKSFCSPPQYPSFNPGVGCRYTPVAPRYLPGRCMPGFTYGCAPFIPSFSQMPLYFGPTLINYTTSSVEVPSGMNSDGTTSSGTDNKNRVEQLLPHLHNDKEIPDASGTSDADMSQVTNDVFKTQSAAKKGADPGCKNAATLCKQGKYSDALRLIDNEPGKGQDNGMCSYVRANANFGLGKFEEALKDVQRAQELNPNFAPGYFTEGSILSELNRLPEALKAYSKALSLRNNYPKYIDARAAVYYRMGEYVNAIRDFERVLVISPTDANALYMRGLCYFMVGQYQIAPICYSDYLTHYPDDAAALANRGSAYFELGKYNEAIADFDRVLSLEPKYVSCLYKRCLANWHLGRWQLALSDADNAISIVGWKDPNSAYVALCAYLLNIKDKDQEGANSILQNSLKNLDSKTWPYPIFQYFAGQISESDLFLMSTSKDHWTQARTYVALKHDWLGTTGKDAALKLLEQVRAEGDSSVPEYNIAVGELFRNKVKDVTNAGRPVANRYALVIGVSKFHDPSINLRYSDKDAQDFYNFLINSEGFPKDNVKLMVNEGATRENILGALGENWLPRKANKDDLVLIYFSTHGSPSAMDARGINYLLAHDTDKEVLYATGIPVQDLTRMIKDKVHADRVVVIMDACHSGAAKADDRLKIDAGTISNESGQAVICSSLAEEVSWESKQYQNSVFTHHLIDGFKSKGQKTSIADSFEYTRQHVEQEVWSDRKARQTPVMKSTWSKADLPIAVH